MDPGRARDLLVGAAIVVLENIFRQREAGLSGNDASERGTAQVWGALLASLDVQLFVEVDRDGTVDASIFEPGIGIRGLEVVTVSDLDANLTSIPS